MSTSDTVEPNAPKDNWVWTKVLVADCELVYYHCKSENVSQWEVPKFGKIIDGNAEPTGIGAECDSPVDKSADSMPPLEPISTVNSAKSQNSGLSDSSLEQPVGNSQDVQSESSKNTPTSRLPVENGVLKSTKQLSSIKSSSISSSKSQTDWSKGPLKAKFTHGVQQWNKKQLESYGNDDATQFFYENKFTGETQWIRPVDYKSDDEMEQQVDFSEISFNIDQSVLGILRELQILPLENQGTPSGLTDCKMMKKTGEDFDGKCERRLRQIYLAMKRCGSLEEWKECIRLNNYELVRNSLQHWFQHEKVPAKVRFMVCKVLDAYYGLDTSVIQYCVGDSCGISNKDFLQNLYAGLREKPKDESVLCLWLSLLYSFMRCLPAEPSVDLPGEELIGRIVRALSSTQEEAFLAATHSLLALNFCSFRNSQLQQPGPDNVIIDYSPETSNIVLRALHADAKNAVIFSEAVLYLLNSQAYPYTDSILLCQLLCIIRTLFSCEDTKTIFHTTDLRVLVDIIIGQLRNLPDDDTNRVEYLRIMDLIMKGTQWDNYRQKDFVESLNYVLRKDKNTMDPLALKFAKKSLLVCLRMR